MFRSSVFCVLLGLVAVVTSIPSLPSSDSIQTIVIDANSKVQDNLQVVDPFGWKNLFGLGTTSELKNTNDVADLLTASQLTVVPSTEVGDVRRYTIGKRVQNDRLVGRSSDGKRWSSPQDVTLALKYPNSGQGALITYVEIVVNQSSSTGKAYIVTGGVGQHFITIVVEAKTTLWFSYTANIYGL